MPTATDRITKTPNVCGGDACIRGTRITVWGLLNQRRLGATDAEILQAVQGLTPADLESRLGVRRRELEGNRTGDPGERRR